MVYFPALNLLFPANVLFYWSIFNFIVGFDVFGSEVVNEAIFDFTETEPLNLQLSLIGFDTSNFIWDTKYFFYILVILVILLLAFICFTLLLRY